MPEAQDLGPTSAGAVMADVGGDRGALVLYAPESLLGAEIEISRAGDFTRVHAAVRERRAGATRTFAVFYPALAAGDYVVWSSATTTAGTVAVVGGEVAELSLGRGSGAAGAPFAVATDRVPSHSKRPVGTAGPPPC